MTVKMSHTYNVSDSSNGKYDASHCVRLGDDQVT